MMKSLVFSLAVLAVSLSARAEESDAEAKVRINAQFKEGVGKGPAKDSDAVYAAGSHRKVLASAYTVAAEEASDRRRFAADVPALWRKEKRPSRWDNASHAAGRCIKRALPPAAAGGSVIGAVFGVIVGAAVTAPGVVTTAVGIAVGIPVGAAGGAAVAILGATLTCTVFHYAGAAVDTSYDP